jgi:hypothetical protein
MSPLEQFRLQLMLEFEAYRQEVERANRPVKQAPSLDSSSLLSEVNRTEVTVN